ncbi:synaptobrevin-1-like [Dermacentor silvarum]|uniref:synaptobrevin-1-like n=1 Tax=Dermacentor silvarum TaxID=543639 RepID=UPI001897E434|nr:synaptobrevin-1-like [Dermacentor silvarum]XP_049520223.1 synaptobrevin-1-like [Dermacentor silvarum]
MSQPGAAGGHPGANQERAPRPPNPQHQAAAKRIQETQAHVDEIVGMMRTNVERDQKLSELDDHAGKREGMQKPRPSTTLQ